MAIMSERDQFAKQRRSKRFETQNILHYNILEAVAQPVLKYWKGMVSTVPNSRPSNPRLQPLRANDGPQGLKPRSFGSGFGTTEVVPFRDSEEVVQQLLSL